MRRRVLLWAAIAIAPAAPAFSQLVPVQPASVGPRDANISVPDFGGMWVHPTIPGFELPLSGPGPIRNRSRLPNGVGNFMQLVGDYTNPILKPHAADIVKKHGDMSLSGIGYPTPSNQCWPGGVPYAFFSTVVLMFQKPNGITILYQQNHQVRHIRLNEPHVVPVRPSYYGDSVGHYEGDTLVIDTVGMKVGPYPMVDMYGTPHSPTLHVVERYRWLDYEATKEAVERDEKENLRLPDYRNDAGLAVDAEYRGKGLQLEFTVEDESVFTMPWTSTITYRRGANGWREQICAENRREYYNNKDADVPTAKSPDF
jgi:hypothetical protein